ncbi:hypothetical protein D4T97_010315 [Siminovitchia acidinfaciens]|uniref:Superoxide dismutase [Cu-Zn] n=2 Tax=Siminovitchia acidinfaciens TaxID=2321395 RepID=A0A429XZ43_9BACI|nr:hypothetical protein D4T97_010315 [Siminovitchia acidinfaciens]
MMSTRYFTLILLLGILLAGCAGAGNQEANKEETSEKASNAETDAKPQAETILKDTEDNNIGTVSFFENGDQIQIEADIKGLTPGHHGFHLHENGVCEADAPDGPFTTAGGHFNPDGKDHPDHAGDLPSLYVNEDGQAKYSASFDRVTMKQMTEGPLAVVIHAGPDNFGNIPERYESEGKTGPDKETVKAGDAGDRQACGVITTN